MNNSGYIASKRQRLIEGDLLSLKEHIKLSERNISIVEEYAAGATCRELSEKYHLSPSRIPQIVFNYIHHCRMYQNRTGKYARVD